MRHMALNINAKTLMFIFLNPHKNQRRVWVHVLLTYLQFFQQKTAKKKSKQFYVDKQLA